MGGDRERERPNITTTTTDAVQYFGIIHLLVKIPNHEMNLANEEIHNKPIFLLGSFDKL